MSTQLGYNPGLEMVNCYTKYFDAQETKLNAHIDELTTSNTEVEILSKLMNRLAHAKQKKIQADFSNDPEMRRYIAHIHKNNPSIFDDLVKGVPTHLPSENNSVVNGLITLESHLDRSLQNVHMNSVEITPLDEEMIDVVIHGLEGETKKYSAKLQEVLMKVQSLYDDRAQMTENARQIIKQSADLLESINRKMSK